LLAHDRWFSPETPASSTTKTGRHGIGEILLKVALSTINQSSQCPGKYYQRGRKKILQDCIPGVLKEMKKKIDNGIGFNKILVNKQFQPFSMEKFEFNFPELFHFIGISHRRCIFQ
jgi:hypothetical protein